MAGETAPKLFVTGCKRPEFGYDELELVRDDRSNPIWRLTPCERDGLSFRDHHWVVYEEGAPMHHRVITCSLTP